MMELTEWDSFYVIVGTAAGALIGLQFVVMALIAAKPPVEANKQEKPLQHRLLYILVSLCFWPQ